MFLLYYYKVSIIIYYCIMVNIIIGFIFFLYVNIYLCAVPHKTSYFGEISN